MHKHRRWITVVLAVLMLRAGIGPALVGVQMISGAFEPGGSCGNARFPVPNTDLISWMLGGRNVASFEEACDAHDRCYGMLGQAKAACDWAFWDDMQDGCARTYTALNTPWLLAQTGRLGCGLQAETYFVAVAGPLLTITYCNERYYTRVGSRSYTPDPLTALRECGQDR